LEGASGCIVLHNALALTVVLLTVVGLFVYVNGNGIAGL
jgi:hypothetical protein